jgi:Protein of unknown function (DUF1097)
VGELRLLRSDSAGGALRSSTALIFGVVMAWAVAIVVAGAILPLSASLATTITAGIASFLIALASARRILSVVPATFHGFASTFAYLSLEPGAFTISAMTGFSWENAIVAVPISLVIGTGLGVTHGWLAHLLAGGGCHAPRRFAVTARSSARRGSEGTISSSSARQVPSEQTLG